MILFSKYIFINILTILFMFISCLSVFISVYHYFIEIKNYDIKTSGWVVGSSTREQQNNNFEEPFMNHIERK